MQKIVNSKNSDFWGKNAQFFIIFYIAKLASRHALYLKTCQMDEYIQYYIVEHNFPLFLFHRQQRLMSQPTTQRL